MRRFLFLLPLLIFPLRASAQNTPTFEIFGGYSNLYANFNTSSFDMNGGNVSVQENLNSWFGGVLDFSTHFGTENGFAVNTQTASYGPVFSYRRMRNVVPFAHAMVGAQRGSPNYLGISQPEERICVLAGGGLDFRVTPRVGLRLLQADYLMGRFSGTRQDNLRLSAGILFFLGKKR